MGILQGYGVRSSSSSIFVQLKIHDTIHNNIPKRSWFSRGNGDVHCSFTVGIKGYDVILNQLSNNILKILLQTQVIVDTVTLPQYIALYVLLCPCMVTAIAAYFDANSCFKAALFSRHPHLM